MSRLGRPGPQDLNALCLPPTAPPTDSPARLGPRTTDFLGWLIGVDWNEGPGYMGISLDGLSHRAALPAVNNSAWRAFPRKPGARPLLVAGEMQRDMVPLRVSIHHDSQSSGSGSTATLGSGDGVQGKGRKRLWARGTEQCQAGSVCSPRPQTCREGL